MGRIILDCDLMRFPNSGLYHYCLNLGREVNQLLTEQGKKGMKFYVPPTEAHTFGDPPNTIIEKPFHKFFKPFLFDCDLWHAPFQSGRVLPNKKSVKVLLTIHDLNPLHEGKPVEEQRKSLAHTKSLIDRSHAIVCISDFTRSDVLKHCDVGNKKIFVVHNGTHAVGNPALSDNSYRPSRPFVFTMGYVNRKKNFHVLLALLQEEAIELVIAGRLDEPDYIKMIEEEAVKMGVASRLRILGPVSENEKAWYLQNCQAFALPSLAEGFGAPVVEAMQFGKPLFLSDRTSLPEIGGDVAFYFRDFNAANMLTVYKEGMSRYQSGNLKERILQRSREFNWKNKAKEYLEVYRTILNT